MRRSRLYIASLLIVALPASAGEGSAVRGDPLDEVVVALDQGRHWYAARLLRTLERKERRTPEAALLAARADAGRGAWGAVARRLGGVSWLDSIGFGEGRTLLARAQFETDQPERAAANYRVFLGYSLERRPRAIAEVGLARALASLGQAEASAAAYARAAQLLPELQPWSSIRAAEVFAPNGDTAAVRRLLERATDVPLYRRTLAEASALEQAGDREQALRLLLGAADSRAAINRTADLRAQAARVLLELGDTAAARGTLRTAIRMQPKGAKAAAELLAGLPGLTPEDHLRLGRAFEASRAPRQAANHYRRYLKLRPRTEAERQETRLKIGELLYRGGSYFAAVDELEQLIASEPEPAVEARAEFIAARATYRRGWRREGRARLREVADRYPGTATALKALSLLGDLWEAAGKAAMARAVYQETADRYPGSRAAPLARYRLGILAFQDGDYATAREHFDRVRGSGRWNELRIRATYWAARSRLAEGEPDRTTEAERLFRAVQARDPFGYYGLLAAERLGIDPWAGLSPGPEPTPISEAIARKFATIELLRQAGLDEEAAIVLRSIVDSEPSRPEEMLGLAQALAKHGFGQVAVRFGWRAHARLRGIWSASVLRGVYPLAYREIIVAEARSRRLDPYLVAAIARQESAFEPDVVSRAGARGLLQLMPETGRWWADRLGIRDYSDDQLFHPETNVHLGAAYFADLRRRYGELRISLVAYNAGPTRARRWRKRPEYSRDLELFAERIPLSETRGYVRNVLAQYRIYRHLYPDLTAGAATD
jgi:soluble lytic murein transglycosylase